LIGRHYDLYAAWVKGLKGGDIGNIQVNNLKTGTKTVGSKNKFIADLENQRRKLKPYVFNVYPLLKKLWAGETPFVFEGAQGVGLDPRWGVYPDVTASDPTFSGILSSTEGIVNPQDIQVKAAVYKATYTSSVGKRILPTKMEEGLATKIREEANEYGATTRRPRDIYYIDLPALKYFAKVSGTTHMVLTHLDISYTETPVKVCISYRDKKGKMADYRPDQEYLNDVRAIYRVMKSWDGSKIKNVTTLKDLPKNSLVYVNFLAKELDLIPFILTTGPSRGSLITINSPLL